MKYAIGEIVVLNYSAEYYVASYFAGTYTLSRHKSDIGKGWIDIYFEWVNSSEDRWWEYDIEEKQLSLPITKLGKWAGILFGAQLMWYQNMSNGDDPFGKTILKHTNVFGRAVLKAFIYVIVFLAWITWFGFLLTLAETMFFIPLLLLFVSTLISVNVGVYLLGIEGKVERLDK